MAAAARIYQLRIALPYIAPPIWRRLEVPGAMTFYELHDAIQIAMGWENCHLWAFYVGKIEVSPASEQMDFPGVPSARPADRTTLDQMLDGRRIKFRYVYDMGDDWLHEVKVEKVFAPEPNVAYPRCTGGARVCPPEDCGGFPGYLRLLEVMADPKHPEHGEMLEWVQWVNRMILGDSMVVMNSLLHYESLGGQVQMTYMDPPSGRHLILETKGFDELEDVEKSAAERWVNAVNADGGFGVWTYAVAKRVSDVSALISSAAH